MATPVPLAADGSPLPRRGSATFGRDVRSMFTHIAGNYSLFDHLVTGGQDLLWRPRALWRLDRELPQAPRRILDLGCGPGDLTFLLRRHYPGAEVVGCDFTSAMVRRGEKARKDLDEEGVRFSVGDVLHLPFRSGTFDLVTSAFLVRNLPDLGAGMREMARVLRPGGTMLALEISEPSPGWFRPLFHAYFDRVVPVVGALFRSEGPYRYLSESLRSFPARPAYLELLRTSGFASALDDPQSLGIVTGFIARR